MQIAPARPPYVEFYVAAVDDPIRTHEVGYRVTKDVEMVKIVPMGSKDNLLKRADEWLEQIKRKALDGAPDAMPDEWVRDFRKKYELWKEGKEAPLNGTSVKEWPILSPAQAENLVSLRIMTIEDVAEMNEEAMQRYGMGAREMKEKAKEWLKGKQVADAVAKENEALRAELDALKEQMAQLLADKPRRGRQPKEQ